MQDAGSAVRKYHLSLVQQSKENEKRRKATRKMAIVAMRYAWITGHEVLYKFKGMTGDPHEHAIDMLTNSRIYFSKPDQFNDPLDCAPSCRLIRDPPDQA
jgi:hypothetical protein